MEPWFIFALIGATFAGVSNITFKIAAKRNYNSSLFSLYGGIAAIAIIFIALVVRPQPVLTAEDIKWLAFFSSIVAAVTGILKVVALRHIDSTIYFPLFKLIAPSLMIVAGVFIFAESFTKTEWVGMVLGLTVPLLLISKSENGRQSNLVAGLVLVGVTGLMSAISAVLYKYVIDANIPVLVTLWFSAWGIFVGSVLSVVYTKGWRSVRRAVKTESSSGLICWGSLRSVLISVGFACILYAYTLGGTLAIVQTIQSLYILIPIVFSIVFYKEHWNLQKVVAIVLSVAALGLMG